MGSTVHAMRTGIERYLALIAATYSDQTVIKFLSISSMPKFRVFGKNRGTQIALKLETMWCRTLIRDKRQGISPALIMICTMK